MEAKSIEQHFAEWHAENFRFGYGTGEEHWIPALKTFLAECEVKSGAIGYDYAELQAALTPTVAWLLINALCACDIIEYGTSPRYGWLTPQGVALHGFMASKTEDELYELATETEPFFCAPDYCNCGPEGYTPKKLCHNPFWIERPRAA